MYFKLRNTQQLTHFLPDGGRAAPAARIAILASEGGAN